VGGDKVLNAGLGLKVCYQTEIHKMTVSKKCGMTACQAPQAMVEETLHPTKPLKVKMILLYI
jgi:hypothetical protein